MMVFAEYQSLVLETYERKKAANALSRRLMHVSPANLKEECSEVCLLRYSRKDEPTLRTFFGEHNGVTEYIKAIKRHDTDKFRPVVNLIRGKVSDPDEKNVELLAWLIDFDQRPYVYGKRYYNSEVVETPEAEADPVPLKSSNEETVMEEEVVDAGTEVEDAEAVVDEGPAVGGETKRRELDGTTGTEVMPPIKKAGHLAELRRRPLIILCLVAMLAAVGVYLALHSGGPEGCMFWAGDHYERISCNEKKANTLIIAYDAERLEHFRRITTPDTITNASIGRVWYIKLDGNIEFYTAGGHHPIRIDKKLHPITEYIIRIYCQPATIVFPPPVVDSVKKN